MKIIAADNFARDTVPEWVVAEGLTPEEAKDKLREFADTQTDDGPWWYRIEPEDYVLYKWEP